MKKILVACGAGIATSTAVITKIKNLLDQNGYENQYTIKQCKISETPSLSDNADFLIATTAKPSNLNCDFISGVPFLTGMGKEATEKEILDLMKK
ncbi:MULTISPECIES: PTS sugar transporter subunit IIB [Anaerococcus]|jgi:phosphotransferase system lactose/cellobiose-specific IIB subunit|uniref:Galactitol-specific phosphotransferase enzyme IIB component n=1 Tax=Anaerococcus octavius TaxID=54007 RepID=A0A380WYB7_9FIRM|nr:MULTISPECIES: PTS sugar transporter subunit IIB [Anaerococcus]MDU0894895.1 PTS sugar transporter subunit IIB [Anaerococcus sp.]MDU3176815.1 PTS sugar transporter subunit IIB [Anaerococcus sp.]MDU5534469.1 PTS sugar transporter subunit IIB [Anaerococcus sp.]SUU93164.1 Galactitol-specific phosphotransferase enzyme IIB component [Anaerococcus octavius]